MEASGLLRTNHRSHWIHPFFRERDAGERFRTFYNNIRKHETKFFGYYRMSVKLFDELLQIMRPHLTKMNTQFRNAITAEERLTITLR